VAVRNRRGNPAQRRSKVASGADFGVVLVLAPASCRRYPSAPASPHAAGDNSVCRPRIFSSVPDFFFRIDLGQWQVDVRPQVRRRRVAWAVGGIPEYGRIAGLLAGLCKSNKAKSILMNSRGLSEEDAYKIIRDQAMSKRVTAEEIADAVINANEILGFDLKS
jgi:hypothetical protein